MLKNLLLILTGLLLGIFSVFLFQYLIEINIFNNPYKKITLPIIARGDFVAPRPIEEECQQRALKYIGSQEYLDYNFRQCTVSKSKAGGGFECVNGQSSMGCSICELKCTKF